MPISHRLKVLFIHIPRTGGHSLERALEMRDSERIGQLCEDRHALFGINDKERALHHYSLAELVSEKLLTKHQLDNYFKFSFVRNPWDKMVSEYFWRGCKQDGQSISFDEFIIKFLQHNVATQDLYSDHYQAQHKFIMDSNGSVAVDFVGRFENLSNDFAQMCQKYQLPNSPLKTLNGTKHLHYSRYYNEESRKLVGEVFREDIELFDYHFELEVR